MLEYKTESGECYNAYTTSNNILDYNWCSLYFFSGDSYTFSHDA